jgi:type II secretory pathway component PulF
MDTLKQNWVIVLVALLIGYYLVAVVPEQARKKQNAETLKKSQSGEFVPNAYATDISADLSGYVSSAEPYQNMLDLTDEQIRAVWLYWSENLSRKHGNKNLLAAIQSASWGWWVFSTDTPKMLMTRLKKLNLT